MTSIPREFLGAEKTRLGRQHWYHMFGPVLANYATRYPHSEGYDARDAVVDEEVLEDSLDVTLCVTCQTNPTHPPHPQCSACRLAFKQHNMTPPDKARTKTNQLRRLCVICKERPARKQATKCAPCSYKKNTTPCIVCGISGVRIQKDRCDAHYNAWRKAEKDSL